MICKYCRNIMLEVDSYNPPYPEPSEVTYKCSYCGAVANDSECYGIEWEKGDK